MCNEKIIIAHSYNHDMQYKNNKSDIVALIKAKENYELIGSDENISSKLKHIEFSKIFNKNINIEDGDEGNMPEIFVTSELNIINFQLDILEFSSPAKNEPSKIITACKCAANINLVRQSIYNIMPDIYKFSRLKNIQLCGNHIKKLPDEIGNIRFLQVLNLASNDLVVIPDSIGKLENLIELNVMHNRLSNLPRTFCSLKSLKLLYIQSNNFMELPEVILGCKSLITIQYYNNKIDKIPYEFLNLPFLIDNVFSSNNPIKYNEKSFTGIKNMTLTLEEKCLRKVMTECLDVPVDTNWFSIQKLKNVRECYFCGRPYFDVFHDVVSEKIVDGNTVIFSEKLCSDHYHDAKSRTRNILSVGVGMNKKYIPPKGYPEITKIFSIYSYDISFIQKSLSQSYRKRRRTLKQFWKKEEYEKRKINLFELADGYDEVESKLLADLYYVYGSGIGISLTHD